MPRVVHCKKISSPGVVYIGRPSKWGNPFVIGRDGTRQDVVAKYRAWIQTQPELLAALEELRGKDLACWCAPQACHGDVLLELANAPKLKAASKAQACAWCGNVIPQGEQYCDVHCRDEDQDSQAWARARA